MAILVLCIIAWALQHPESDRETIYENKDSKKTDPANKKMLRKDAQRG